jgi:hypothetical protein
MQQHSFASAHLEQNFTEQSDITAATKRMQLPHTPFCIPSIEITAKTAPFVHHQISYSLDYIAKDCIFLVSSENLHNESTGVVLNTPQQKCYETAIFLYLRKTYDMIYAKTAFFWYNGIATMTAHTFLCTFK